MFTLANEGKVWWKVNLVARDAEGGDPTDAPVLLLYRIFTRSELKARERKLQQAVMKVTKAITAPSVAPAPSNAAAQSDQGAGDVATSMDDMESIEAAASKDLEDRVCDWKQIVDAEGEPIKFTKATLKALLNDEAQYSRVMAGLLEASRGARAKNSSPGAAGTRAPGQN